MNLKLKDLFEKSKVRASQIINDKEKTSSFLDEAQQKAKKNKSSLGNSFSDFHLLIRLIKSWINGNYKGISKNTIILVLGAIIYFVNPFDILPDFIFGLGFADDLTILTFALSLIKDDIEKFKHWEKSNQTL